MNEKSIFHSDRDRGLPFPHHTLAADEPEGQCEWIAADKSKPIEEPSIKDSPEMATRLRDAGVCEIILVHGTFVGNDNLGLLRTVGRVSPSLADRVSGISKRWLDEVAGEVGNFSESFADCLSSLINSPTVQPIPVTRFHWSSENHTLGRARGAIGLLDYLLGRSDPTASFLVMTHSHGGNLVAMLSHLISAEPQLCNRVLSHVGEPVSPQVARFLERQRRDPLSLDVANFGTPLRYRWNRGVCQRLMHFTHHRSIIDDQPLAVPYPPSPNDLMEARAGDYIQYLGIAGTDFLAVNHGHRDWIRNRRLQEMFEPGLGIGTVLERLKRGRRASLDGTTLLVDYPSDPEGWNRKLLGHGIYTSRQWLPFHLREMVNRFYRDN